MNDEGNIIDEDNLIPEVAGTLEVRGSGELELRSD
jgi:hypothetical protein